MNCQTGRRPVLSLWPSAADSERSLAASPHDADYEANDHNDRPDPQDTDLRELQYFQRYKRDHLRRLLYPQLDLPAFHLIELQCQVLREHRIIRKVPVPVLHIEPGIGDIAH